MESYESSPLFDERERAALALANAIVSTPQAVDDAVFARAQTHFTSDELVELVMVAAWENTVARYNHAFGVESMNLWRSGAR